MTHTQGSHLPEVSKLMGRKQWLLPQGKPRLGVTDTGGSTTCPCLHAKLDSFVHSFTGEAISFLPEETPPH